MAKYKVLKKSHINNRIVEEGEIIEFDGIPHLNLEPVDKEAEKIRKENPTKQIDAVALARQSDAARGVDVSATEELV